MKSKSKAIQAIEAQLAYAKIDWQRAVLETDIALAKMSVLEQALKAAKTATERAPKAKRAKPSTKEFLDKIATNPANTAKLTNDFSEAIK